MALHVIDGIMGSGKSYYIVNDLLRDVLTTTDRPVVVTENLEIQWGVFFDYCAEHLPRRIRKKQAERIKWMERARERVTTIGNYDRPLIDQETGRPMVIDPKAKSPRVPTEVEMEYALYIDDETKPVVEEGAYVFKWLDDGTTAPVYEQKLHSIGGAEPYIANEMGEFWYFTKPNSVIIYDEAADKLNSRKYRDLMDTKLQSYINHSRHYKDDLYFIAQAYEDLDKQIREKFHYLHNVRNSLKTPMLEANESGLMTFLFGGMCYPWQFFIVDSYAREAKRLRHFVTERVWPKPEGFANYSSFSKPADIAGKALDLDGTEKSEDFGASWFERSKMWLKRLPSILTLFAIVGLTIWFLWAALNGKLGPWLQGWIVPDGFMDTPTQTETDITEEAEAAKEPEPTTSTNEPIQNTPNTNDDPKPVAEPTETIILVTPKGVVTSSGKRYRTGDLSPSLREQLKEFLSGWQ